MKARSPYLPLFPVLAAGMMLLPMTMQAQDAPRESAPGGAPQATANPEQIQAMVRELQELHRAGKREEARPLIQRLRTLAKENPQLAETLHNAMKPQEQPMAQQNPTPAPAPPQMRPHMPGGQEHPMGQPNMAGQQPPMAWPHMQSGQDRPMVQPHGFGGWGSGMGQSNMPGPQQPQARQQMSGGQCGPMIQSIRHGDWVSRMEQSNMAWKQRPMARKNMLGWQGGQMFRSHRQGGWGPRMEPSNATGNQRHMGRKNMLGWQGGAMFRSHRHGGWGPRMVQPNAAGPQRQMIQPNTAQAQRPMVRPNLSAGQAQPPVQADQSQAAKVRHLRQAAEHLAAAGFAEQATKAREESARMEKELNQRKAQAPTNMPAPRETSRRDLNQDNNVKPEANRTPDPNAAMLNEMRKLGKQIQQLNSRMQKLETRGAE
ncbi:MAG: hypothetical protein WCO57_16520, partial [Verrucomicrobiota bacterium]